MATLNARQERFCHEYLKDLNAHQAALRAGYAPITAKTQGSRLLNHPGCIPLIEVLKTDRNLEIKIDGEWVLRRLVELADVDIAHLFNPKGGLVDMHDMPEDVKRLIAGIETTEDTLGKVVTGYTRKVKLSDRLRVLEMIGKHTEVGAFVEKIEVDAGENMADLILAARRRHRAAEAKREGNGKHEMDEMGEEQT